MSIEFTGDQEDWDLIWETIRTDMESSAFSPELRDEITGAYNRIMDANDPDRTAPLAEEDIVVGKSYRIRNIEGVKRSLHGKLVICISKSPLLFRLLSPVRGFRLHDKISFNNWMLEEVTQDGTKL